MEQPKTLQQAIQHFSDEQVCIDTVAAARWPHGPECPACGRKEHWYLKSQKRWKCKECNKQFTVKLGTIFEDSPIPLNKWLVALWMLANCRNGVSSYEVARAIGITQKSAWFVLHRLRLAMQRKTLVKLGGSGNPVEVDETFIGGKARNMHRSRRAKINVRSHANAKTVVLGMLERGGHVRAEVLPDRRKPQVFPHLESHIAKGSKIITDEYPVYYDLKNEYDHQIVNHLETYVKGNVHTNTLENFWSLLKRGLGGTYVAVEPFHLFRYVDEQAFRYNHRKDADNKSLPDSDRFALALSQVAGKRVTFAEVTGKVGETAF